MNIKPLGKRVLVKPLKKGVKTSSGIILPESEGNDNENIAIVEAIGEVSEVKIGDKIIFKKYSGTELKDSDEKYLILDINDILGLIY